MKYNDALFEHHIIFEFLHNTPNKVSLLYEGHSVVPGIDTILEKILELFEPQIQEVLNSVTGRSVARHYNDIKKLGLTNLFFDEIDFDVVLTRSEEENSRGLFEQRNYKYLGADTKIPLIIAYNVEAPNEEGFRKLLYQGFGHEITHAYVSYQYMMKYKKDFTTAEFNQKTGYNNFHVNIWDAQSLAAIKRLHYVLSRVEMNACLAQLRQELLSNKDEIVDAKSGLKILKSTRSFMAYAWAERQINILNGVTNDIMKQWLINTTESISGRKFKNYNQLLKYYQSRWERYKKDYMIKASKILYDIYSGERYILDGENI